MKLFKVHQGLKALLKTHQWAMLPKPQLTPLRLLLELDHIIRGATMMQKAVTPQYLRENLEGM